LIFTVWHDLPSLVVEYRSLEYSIPVPVKQPIFDLYHALTSIPRKFITKTIDFKALRKCDGIIRPGETTLILAPPGHGKSLLLKALAGRLNSDKYCKGDIRYNGLTFNEAIKKGWYINKLAAYVEQVDIHIAQLTVRETFEFAVLNSIADIDKLPIDEQAKRRLNAKKKAELVIESLGLKECQDTIIGNEMVRGVSGELFAELWTV